MKNILFICIENSCRSQMAEAFAKIHGHETVNANSAGSIPSGKVNKNAIMVMDKVGYDLSAHYSKSTDVFSNIEFDTVISMGCGDACPHIAAKQRIEWDIPDPKDMDMDEFIKVRDLIEDNVKQLLGDI